MSAESSTTTMAAATTLLADDGISVLARAVCVVSMFTASAQRVN
jgi:hypothetical protein